MIEKLDPDTELRLKEEVTRLVDSKLFPLIEAQIAKELGNEMLRTSKSNERDDLAAEYRLMTRFLNRLNSIANEVRTLQNQKARKE